MVLSREITARAAYAAAVLEGGGQVATHPISYNVSQGTSLSFIQHIGTISRTAIKFDTGNTSLGSTPIGITFSFRRVGNPTGVIKTGIRKASDDSFIPIADWLAEYTRPGSANNINTVTVEGSNTYSIVANDKFSIEYSGTATAGIEVLMNPQQTNPVAAFTTQQYTRSYATSANALAATIKTR
jgi:hypothetical protein